MSAQILAEVDLQITINYGVDQSTTTNLTTFTCSYEDITYIDIPFNLRFVNTYLGEERTDFSMGELTYYKEEADGQIVEIPENTTELTILVSCQYNHGYGNNFKISYIVPTGLSWGYNQVAPSDSSEYICNSNYMSIATTKEFRLYPINPLTVNVDLIPTISGETPYILFFYGGSVEYWETGETLNNFVTTTLPSMYTYPDSYLDHKLVALQLSNFINVKNVATQYNYTIFLLSRNNSSGVFTNYHYEVIDIYQDASYNVSCTITESPLSFSINSTTPVADQFV